MVRTAAFFPRTWIFLNFHKQIYITPQPNMALTWNLDQKQIMTGREYTRTKISNNYISTGNYDHMSFSSQVFNRFRCYEG